MKKCTILDSYVLFTPYTVHAFGSYYTHSFGTETHTWRVRPPKSYPLWVKKTIHSDNKKTVD